MAIKVTDFFDPLGPGAEDLAAYTKAIQALARNYRNFRKGLDEDGERVKTLLAGLGNQGGQLATTIEKLNLANAAEAAQFAALKQQLGQLATEHARLQQVVEAQAKAQTVVRDATDQAKSAYRALQNELRQAYAAGDTARIEKAALAIRAARTETSSLSQALRGTNSELTAARGSYDALDAQNKKLIATLRALGDGVEGNEEKVAALQAQIAQNTTKLREFDANILVFTRNVGNYSGSFSQLVAELAKARAAQDGLQKGTAAYEQQQQRIIGFQTAAQKSAAQLGLSYEQAEAKLSGAGQALQPLATNLVRLEREQLNLAATTGKETEEYRKLGFQIQQTKKQLDDVAVSTVAAETRQGNLAQQLGFTKEGLGQYAAGLATSTIGLAALAQASQAVFQANVEYSRELAEVRKTTGLTADEADRLADSLKALDTPTNMAGLLKIAAIGGQLGIAKTDLLEFTKAIDIASQALSNDFAGGPEEIATTLGKIASVYRRELGPDIAQNILAIGSAVNQLSADGAATAPYLTDVELRIGAIASSSRLGIANGLAYAAVLQEQGFAAEVSGTALNRLFSTLSVKTKQAYEIAKLANPALTLKEFTRVVNTDFNQAIQLFLRGLQEGGKTTTEQARLLATLKLQSGEAKSAIVTLAQNTELFAERQKTANEQLREATSLGKEAAINTDTLAGSYETLKNNASELVTGGALGAILKYLVAFVAFDLKLISAGFRGIGDSFTYLAQKAGIIDKPLTDYTASMVESALAARKTASANQELLDSYTKLQAVQGRSAAQELELAQLRSKLLAAVGTDEAQAAQRRIEAQRGEFTARKTQLEGEVRTLGNLITGSQNDVAAAQNAANEQDKRLTTEQIARVREIADARAKVPLQGKSTVPELEAAIAANLRLAKATGILTEQERQQGLARAALAKLTDQQTKVAVEATDATEAEAAAEQQLDRAAQERAKNRVAALQDELAANQRRIAAARAYVAEQGKLYSDRQISSQVLAERIGGSEELITQAERDGVAIRIQLVRAESQERLATAENDRIRQSNKKKITEAELADIQGQYAERRKEIARREAVEIEKIQQDFRDKQVVQPLEFKLAEFNQDKYLEDLGRRSLLTYERRARDIQSVQQAADDANLKSLAAGELTQRQYLLKRRKIRDEADQQELQAAKAFGKDTRAIERKIAEERLQDAEEDKQRRIAIIEKVGEYAQFAEQSFYQIKSNLLDKQIQNENAAYENEIKAAGNNAELKEKIEKDHQKRLAKLNYDKAKAERDQALFSIAINTAVAVAKEIAAAGFFGAIPAIAGDLALGAVQAAVVLSRPLPQYFRGRQSGPAEWAEVAERGPELVGQPGKGYRLETKPTVTYLSAGDRVYTATETHRILASTQLDNQITERISQRHEREAGAAQLQRLRSTAALQQQAVLLAQRSETQAVLQELRQVRRAIQEQEYRRLNEQDDLVRSQQIEQQRRDHLNKRYRPNAPK